MEVDDAEGEIGGGILAHPIAQSLVGIACSALNDADVVGIEQVSHGALAVLAVLLAVFEGFEEEGFVGDGTSKPIDPVWFGGGLIRFH